MVDQIHGNLWVGLLRLTSASPQANRSRRSIIMYIWGSKSCRGILSSFWGKKNKSYTWIRRSNQRTTGSTERLYVSQSPRIEVETDGEHVEVVTDIEQPKCFEQNRIGPSTVEDTGNEAKLATANWSGSLLLLLIQNGFLRLWTGFLTLRPHLQNHGEMSLWFNIGKSKYMVKRPWQTFIRRRPSRFINIVLRVMQTSQSHSWFGPHFELTFLGCVHHIKPRHTSITLSYPFSSTSFSLSSFFSSFLFTRAQLADIMCQIKRRGR